MGSVRRCAVAVAALLLSGAAAVPQAVAGPLDGLAGAAVGFALGAMVARQRPVYYAPRYRRVAVYRSRPVMRPQAAVRRRPGSGGTGFAVNANSDPFAGAKPIPVSAH